MLADPVALVAASPNPVYNFAVVRSDGYGSVRRDISGSDTEIVIQHTPGKTSKRHYVKITFAKDAVNPYTSHPQRVVGSISLSTTYPSFGFTDADKAAFWLALKTFIDDDQVGISRLLQMQS